jgi:hypothetical protein
VSADDRVPHTGVDSIQPPVPRPLCNRLYRVIAGSRGRAEPSRAESRFVERPNLQSLGSRTRLRAPYKRDDTKRSCRPYFTVRNSLPGLAQRLRLVPNACTLRSRQRRHERNPPLSCRRLARLRSGRVSLDSNGSLGVTVPIKFGFLGRQSCRFGVQEILYKVKEYIHAGRASHFRPSAPPHTIAPKFVGSFSSFRWASLLRRRRWNAKDRQLQVALSLPLHAEEESRRQQNAA